jgi:hypothetical protein
LDFEIRVAALVVAFDGRDLDTQKASFAGFGIEQTHTSSECGVGSAE